MAITLVPFHAQFLRPRDATFALRTVTRSGGRSMAGVEQIISPGIRFWEVTYQLPTEFDGARLRGFEALVRRMKGRENVAAMSICDPYRYGDRRAPVQQAFSDGTWFSDGTGHIVAGGGAQPLLTTVAAAIGATSLTVGLTNPTRPNLAVGDFFSIWGFLYAVDEVDGTTITFSPGLRSAAPAGTQLRTDPATFYGRFSTDDQGIRAREMLRWGAPVTITFQEAFDR